jgi:hypothetical protein
MSKPKPIFVCLMTLLTSIAFLVSASAEVHFGYSQTAAGAISILSSSSFTDDIGYYHVVGEVTNQGSQKATFVKVSGAFYNSSNTVVAADFTYTDPKDLESGQTAPFEIIVNAPTANDITSASLNIDSKQYSSIVENETS